MEIRRAVDRAVSHETGIVGYHCFSYGSYYDPDNVGFGPLIAANVFDLEPGAGFDLHPHAGMTIVTWVAEGELTHVESGGPNARLAAGSAAVLWAGDGVEHSERNEGPTPARIVQLFLHPGPPGAPRYQHRQLRSRALEPVVVAKPRPGSQALSSGVPGATVRYLDQPPHAAADLPVAAGLWGLVLAGSAALAEVVLETGDEMRAWPAPRRIQAGDAGARLLLVSLD